MNGIITALSYLDKEVIIFGGLTIISLALVLLVWRLSVRYGNHMSDFIKLNTDAWILNAKNLERNSSCLDRLRESIEDLYKAEKNKT